MKLIQILEPGRLVEGETNRPVVGSKEILLKLKYIGFCGSDLSTYLGKNPMVQYPRVPGHEISAVVEEIGEAVPSGFEVGEAVTAIPYTNCGKCPSCRKGRINACQFNQTLGVQRDGAMQEYISLPWEKVIRAPSLNTIELAMVEPLTVGFHAIVRGRVNDSDVVAVMGCGMIGSGAIIRGEMVGAKVIAIDIDDHKLELAKDLGAHHTINASKQDIHEELGNLTDGEGPDVIVEAAGNPQTYRAAVDELAFSGRVVYIGYSAKDIAFTTKLFVQKEIDILGSRNATAEDFHAVISYLASGNFPLDKMVTHKVKLSEAAKAIKDWASAPGKVMKILLDLT